MPQAVVQLRDAHGSQSLRKTFLGARKKTLLLKQARLLLIVVCGPASSTSPETSLEVQNLRSPSQTHLNQKVDFYTTTTQSIYLGSGILDYLTAVVSE